MPTNSKLEVTDLVSDGSFYESIKTNGFVPIPICTLCVLEGVSYAMKKLFCELCLEQYRKDHPNAN